MKLTFFDNLIRWRAWVDEFRVRLIEQITWAGTHLTQVEQFSLCLPCNILIADDRRLFEREGGSGTNLVELQRYGVNDKWAPLERFGEPHAFIFSGHKADDSGYRLVKEPGLRIRDAKYTDLCAWCLPRKYPRGDSPQYYRWVSDLRREESALKFADSLLEKEADIREWMRHVAKVYDRKLPETCNHDMPMLIERWVPGTNLQEFPDTGSISCALHVDLDRIALGEPRVMYCY